MATDAERLEAAELVCVLFGWGGDGPTEDGLHDAAVQAWMDWCHLAPKQLLEPKRSRVTKDVIADLAKRRKKIREYVLGRIDAMVDTPQIT